MANKAVDPEPKAGCLALLVLGGALLLGAGALAHRLAETESGRIALGSAFLVVVLVFFGFFVLPQAKKFK